MAEASDGGGKRRQDVILIGPIGTGKSTVGKLLAEGLGLPQVAMDFVRFGYYEEIGYDEDLADEIERREGFAGKYRYWKLFEIDAVERILAEHRDCVIDFGGGHSVYEDDALFERARRALAPYDNVVLLLPSPDLDESVRLLRERHGAPIVDHDLDFDEHFVKHHSNHDLATMTVYTKDKTPEQTCEEILPRLQRSPAWDVSLEARPSTLERANARYAAGKLANARGEYEQAQRLIEESLSVRHRLGTKRQVAESLQELGDVAKNQGEYARARTTLAQSLELRRQLDTAPDIARTLHLLGMVAREELDFRTAGDWFEQALSVWRDLGRKKPVAGVLAMVGESAREQGDYARAAAALEECLALHEEAENRWAIAATHCAQGDLALARAEYVLAQARYEESLRLGRELKDQRASARALEGLAGLAAAQGQVERALRFGGAITALRGSKPRSRVEQALVDRWLQPARQQLDEQASAAAWAAGEAMSLEEATHYALEASG